MRIFRIFQRPEYFFRPVQIWRRLLRNTLRKRNRIQLAWGLPVELELTAYVGEDIANVGVFDRIVPEAILRLLDRGETAIDIGANIGQNLSIMALAAGPAGMTIGFEPGPESWRLLTTNVERWKDYDLSPITLVRKGASDRAGTAFLHPANDLGGFSLESEPPGPVRPRREGATGVDIEVTTLDEFLPEGTKIGLLKIDVEGHEFQVLKGATRLLEQGRIRDIIFEDYFPQPSPVVLYLQAAGYTVFRLFSAWLGPVLFEGLGYPERSAEAPNFLATRDPERARARFRGRGWKCLRVRARLKRAVS